MKALKAFSADEPRSRLSTLERDPALSGGSGNPCGNPCCEEYPFSNTLTSPCTNGDESVAGCQTTERSSFLLTSRFSAR